LNELVFQQFPRFSDAFVTVLSHLVSPFSHLVNRAVGPCSSRVIAGTALCVACCV